MDDKEKELIDTQETDAGEEEAAEPVDPLQAKQAECEAMNQKYLRAIADLENYRKRAAREQQRVAQFAVAALARALLPAADNLERARQAADEGHNFDTLSQGVKMVEQQIHQILRDNNIEPIEALHRPFDPNYHEVVMQQESDEHEEGTITEVFEKGFQIGEIVLRAAKVAVAAAPKNQEPQEEAPDDEQRSNGGD